MIDKNAEQAVFMKDEKWTPDNNVNPLYERQRLAFIREGISDIDPSEMTEQLLALSAQVPKETALFEDILEEAIEAADHAAEPYSRALVMSVIADRLVAACETLDGVPQEHHDALPAAFDLVFGAGRDYQHIEFEEKFLPKILQSYRKSNQIKKDEGTSEHNRRKKENAELWQRIAVKTIEELGHISFFEERLRKEQAGLIGDTLSASGFHLSEGTIKNWLNKYQKEIHSYE